MPTNTNPLREQLEKIRLRGGTRLTYADSLLKHGYVLGEEDIDSIMQLFEAEMRRREAEALTTGRRIQAELTMDKWVLSSGEDGKLEFSKFLGEQVGALWLKATISGEKA